MNPKSLIDATYPYLQRRVEDVDETTEPVPSQSTDSAPSAVSRRSFLRLAGAASAFVAAVPLLTEPELAMAQFPGPLPSPDEPGVVLINFNENPHGPSPAARAAAMKAVEYGGRYQFGLNQELVKTFIRNEGLKAENILTYSGSSEPLQFSVIAFTGPGKSLVAADPSYESAAQAAELNQAPVHKVPLAKDGGHDLLAMTSVDPAAGLIYICNPNNPTGAITSFDAIKTAVENKPKNAIVMVDEAYWHFTSEPSAIEFVKAGADVIVLRTFSKIYGMAGLRCGFAIARPDLLAKLALYGEGFLPSPAMAAAIVSLKDPSLVAVRRKANAATRDEVMAWLNKKGYATTPSQSNCFMVDVKRPGGEVMAAMAKHKVYIGRSWPVWPNWARITVGTPAEMEKFKAVFSSVMA